jgi:hypothetical protein
MKIRRNLVVLKAAKIAKLLEIFVSEGPHDRISRKMILSDRPLTTIGFLAGAVLSLAASSRKLTGDHNCTFMK